MNEELNAEEAADAAGISDRTLRAKLRKLRDGGTIDPAGAWQDPPRPNGIWTIRRRYLAVLASEYGWPMQN